MTEQAPIKMNPFEELCQRGIREGWCWRIPCTTCRAYEYRRSLQHLRTGNRIGRNDHDYPRERLGWWHFNFDPLNESSSPEERRKYKAAEAEVEKGFRVLENVLCDASLWNIATDYWQCYADRTVDRMSMGRNHWLACIGIALDECPSRKVTESWITQLSQMSGGCSKFLSDIWFDSEKLLRWTDLEQFEFRIVRRKSPVESRVDQEDLAQYWEEYREFFREDK